MTRPFAFRVNGLYIAGIVKAEGGYKWTQNDLHDEASGRTMDGVMHVSRIDSKDQLDITCIPVTRSMAVQVIRALKEYPEFMVEYESPEYEEPRTAVFYNSSRNCEFLMNVRGVDWWQNLKFTLTEV